MRALGNVPEAFGYGVTEEDALATIRAALDSPIPYIDTAALYGDGESERRVGLVLRERGGLPENAFLQTKQGRNQRMPTTPARRSNGAWSAPWSCSASIASRSSICTIRSGRRSKAMAPGGPIDVLQQFRDQGVIGHLGVAGGPIPVQIQYIETGLFDAVIHHNRYTLLNRSAEPLIDAAVTRGMAVLNAAPYGSGMLVKVQTLTPATLINALLPR